MLRCSMLSNRTKQSNFKSIEHIAKKKDLHRFVIFLSLIQVERIFVRLIILALCINVNVNVFIKL